MFVHDDTPGLGCEPRPDALGPCVARFGQQRRRSGFEHEIGNRGTARRTDEMDRQFRALVIGGGVVGCNVLYHLTREGWSEVALCERRELTAGATWHSSGHISAYTGDLNLVGLARHTRTQIDRLRTEVEQDLGLHSAGSLRLATRPVHLEEYRRFASVAQTVGVDARVVGPSEALALWPLMNGEGVLGALHLPDDCYLNAAEVAQGLAAAGGHEHQAVAPARDVLDDRLLLASERAVSEDAAERLARRPGHGAGCRRHRRAGAEGVPDHPRARFPPGS